MARKKLNKKVALIAALIGGILILGVGLLAVRHFVGRDPQSNYEKYQRALQAGDYKKAETFLGKAYAYGKTDKWKIERLFELAQLHLTHNEQHRADWPKAIRCWNTVLNIDPKNQDARRELMRYFYRAADSGSITLWKNVHEQSSELLKLIQEAQGQPDTELLLAAGRAALGIARQRGVPNPLDYVTESIQRFETLLAAQPTNAKLYAYLAEAKLLEGQFQQEAGRAGARDQAHKEAQQLLDQAVQKADDKDEALANRFAFRLEELAADADKIEALRKELADTVKMHPNNARLLTLFSQAYELPGKQSAQAELTRAIELAQQAVQADPNNFEYVYRLVMLTVRRASIYGDPAAWQDALVLAEQMKNHPQTRDIPGPEQGRNLAYRNVTNILLCRLYLQMAQLNPDQKQTWLAKVEPIIKDIAAYYGSSENMVVLQWEGMWLAAQNKRQAGIRLMYKAYEQAKALDKPNEPSNIDPLLCAALAEQAKIDNQLGLAREFLEKAINNRNRLIADQPSLILDYAELMVQFGAFQSAADSIQVYQQRYGQNERSRRLWIQASLGKNDQKAVEDALAQLSPDSAEYQTLRLQLMNAKLANLQRQLASEQQNEKTTKADVEKQIEDLVKKQTALLLEMLKTNPEAVEAGAVRSVAIYWANQNQKQQAIALLDAFLQAQPENVGVKTLRLQMDEPNPLQIPIERYRQLQLQAAEVLKDAKQLALVKAAVYRSAQDWNNAKLWYEKAAQADPKNDSDVIREQFDMAIDQEDVKTAEGLLRTIRNRDLDGCEGTLATAQVEFLKGDYTTALRRADEAIAIRPLLSSPYYLKSRIYEKQGDLTRAVEMARQALQFNPLQPMYAKNYASILFNRNTQLGTRATEEQRNELVNALTGAILLNPGDWQLQSVYAEVISQQAPDRALAIRQRLMDDYPSASNALMLGNMALRMAQTERDNAKRSKLLELATNTYKKGLDLEPNNEALKAAQADLLRLTGQGEQAEQLLKDDENLLWRYYLQTNQYDKAQQILTALYAKKADSPELLQGLALVAEGQGKRDALKEYLDKLADLKLEKRDYLWLIQKYLDHNFSAIAAKHINQFKGRYPDDNTILLLEAWLKMTDGKLDEALTLTNQYLETNKDNAGAWRLRGRLHRLKNNTQQAISDLQQSKNIAANAAVSMELATIWIESNQPDAAIGELVTAMQNPQTPLQLVLMLENLYKRLNRAADLEKFYAYFIQTYPDNPFWSLRATEYFLTSKQPAKAMAAITNGWKNASEQNRIDGTLLHLYLQTLMANKQYTAAMAEATKWIDSPLSAIAYANMAETHFLQGQKDKAEQMFFTALDKAGANDAMQAEILNMMLRTIGQEPAARWASQNSANLPNQLMAYRLALNNQQFNKALELLEQLYENVKPDQPQWANYAVQKGNTLIQAYLKTYDDQYLTKTAEIYEQLLKQYPTNYSVMNNLAYLLLVNDKQLSQALIYARQAHQSDPGNPVFLDTYGFALYKNTQVQEAKEVLTRAIQLYQVQGQPAPWEVYYHLAMAYEALNEKTAAVENYQKALSLEPNMPPKDKQTIQDKLNRLSKQ